MKLDAAGRLGHLTYCTNIHQGVTWQEVRTALSRYLPAVKARIAPDRPFGVGLRLAAQAAADLQDEASFAQLQELLASNDSYVFTINGFPYGPFHGVRVKDEVYQPDWSHAERLSYTNQLADILVRLLPNEPGLEGSVSTAPGTFRALGGKPGMVERIAGQMLDHCAHLVGIAQRTGRTVSLSIEPEPMCLLETIDETAIFFERHLLSKAALARLAKTAGLTESEAEAAVRRHIGVCYDVCHAAVEYEDAAASVDRLRRAGIRVTKLQLSAALRVPRMDARIAEWLQRFDDGVYLHQVVERLDSGLNRYVDLQDAFAAYARDASGDREWRVHCHVPVFLPEAGLAGTTQDFLAEILALHKVRPISDHLEVETYTWDVLPQALREVDTATAISRELAWCRDRLGA